MGASIHIVRIGGDMAQLTYGGGVNELSDEDTSLEECISGQNFELNVGNRQFKPRPPFDFQVQADDVSGTVDATIRGIMQLEKRDGETSSLIVAGERVFRWDGSSDLGDPIAMVSAGGLFKDTYWSLDDLSIITDINLQNRLKVWNGVSFSDLTTNTTNAIRAKYALVHNGRVWLANIMDGNTSLPHLVLASAFENHELYDPGTRAGDNGFTGDEAFFLASPDLRPINGFDVFQDEIVISTDQGRLHRLSGLDSTTYGFVSYYAGSAAIGDQSFSNIGNDLVYLRAGGVVESLIATDTSGDVTANDISIKVPKSFEKQENAIVVYDQTLQKVYFFVNGKVMVLFKDLLSPNPFNSISPWSIYRTTHPSQFNAISAKYMRVPGQKDFTVYWGDDQGNVFNMNGGGAGDAGTNSVVSRRKTPLIALNWKPPFNVRLQYRQRSEVNVNLEFTFGEELATRNCPITLKAATLDTLVRNFYNGNKYYNDEAYYAEGIELGALPVTQGAQPAGRGIAAFIEISADSSNDFIIDKLIIGDESVDVERTVEV